MIKIQTEHTLTMESTNESKIFNNVPEKVGSAQIIMTKFKAIQADVPSLPASQEHENSVGLRAAITLKDLRSLSAGDLFQHAKDHPKRPWISIHRNIPEVDQSAENESFRVVWRRLSFEVNLNTYDQLVRRALARMRSFWQLNGLSKSRDEEPDDMASEVASRLGWSSSVDELTSSTKVVQAQTPEKSPLNRKRVIFENLNGYLKSGEITAILGPSGAGKTSLLNAICGRTDNYRGSMRLMGGGSRRMRLSIIPQKDYLMENLTVRENLLYSSRILNTDKKFDHEGNIMRIVKMLNLTHCLHSSAANISGGEYKRVSIGQELLKQPDILILDEPTSGLDSLNCKNLVRSLVQLIEATRAGSMKSMAIVMTIHQPDVDIFQMFDHVYCMARGGQVIFDGHPSEAVKVIREQAGLLPNQMPAAISGGTDGSFSGNPANLLIEIASEQVYGRQPVERLNSYQRKRFEVWLVHSRTTGLGQLLTEATTLDNDLLRVDSALDVNSIHSSRSSSSNSKPKRPPRQTQLARDKRLNAKLDLRGQFWRHTGLLASRAFISTIRDPLMTIISFLFHLFVPFVMYTVYSHKIGSVKACPKIQREMDILSMVSNSTIDMVEEMQEEFNTALECCTMFFLATYSFSMCSLSVAALAFPLNMHVLLKEVRNGWYSLPSFVIGKTIANFPFEVLFPVGSLVLMYLILDMPSSHLEWRLWSIALVMGLVSMISHTQGLIFGALCMDSVQTAIFLASSSTLPQTMLSGFTARIKHMPTVLQKLSWLSMYRYSSDATNIIRFGFGICPCDATTDNYLKTKQPVFTDLPPNMKPLLNYYLTNTAPEVSDIDYSNSSSLNLNSSLLVDTVRYIPGVDYQLILNSTERAKMLRMLDNNELDLFAKMADMMTRSFTYGREINNCDSVRSQLLTTAGAPDDDYLSYLLAGMLLLLISAKLILFVIVKYKIGSRV